jgi:predicted porin
MGGLVLHVAVAAGEGAPGVPRIWDFAATYDIGNLSLGLGYEKAGDANQFAVRGLYTMGAMTLGAYVQQDKNGWGANLGKRTSFRLTGMYAVGSSEFHLAYGKADDYKNLSNSDADQFVVGYNYNLSKRTKVYGYYTKLDSAANGPYGDLSSFAVGVRHNF